MALSPIFIYPKNLSVVWWINIICPACGDFCIWKEEVKCYTCCNKDCNFVAKVKQKFCLQEKKQNEKEK